MPTSIAGGLAIKRPWPTRTLSARDWIQSFGRSSRCSCQLSRGAKARLQITCLGAHSSWAYADGNPTLKLERGPRRQEIPQHSQLLQVLPPYAASMRGAFALLEFEDSNNDAFRLADRAQITSQDDTLSPDGALFNVVMDGLIILFMPSDCDGERLKQVQQLAFLLALARVRLRQGLAAKARQPLGSSKPIPFSRQASARDRMTGSSRSLRGPTSLRVSCPTRGTAVAA